jgi:NadR type nicotinamide-nucleotide adenylyltransferase
MEKRSRKNIKRVVIIGPESTGKTELAQFLAKQYNTVYVPEFARNYVEQLNRPYTYEDIEIIAKEQIRLEKAYALNTNQILFFDTYLIITKVWFQVVYNKIPNWLDTAIRNSKIDLFLLTNTELPWIPDKVRENGGQMREKLFEIYKSELLHYGFNFSIITGTGKKRFNNALEEINYFLIHH